MISLIINRKMARIMTRACFEKYGKPTLVWDLAVYAWPIKMACKLDIPLVIYGENISYEYGGKQDETPYAYEQINNEAVMPIVPKDWQEYGVELEDFGALGYPSAEEIRNAKITPIYLSYFVPWDGRKNYEIAKRYGFRDLSGEWTREGFIENYDQIDTAGYLIHPWLKYPKYGHARATDVSCYWIRTGFLDRAQGVQLVKEHDHKLDQRALDDFLRFTGYTDREFWEIVDRWYNEDLFTQSKDGLWKLKYPVWECEPGKVYEI
jgi:hypothetical protein